ALPSGSATVTPVAPRSATRDTRTTWAATGRPKQASTPPQPPALASVVRHVVTTDAAATFARKRRGSRASLTSGRAGGVNPSPTPPVNPRSGAGRPEYDAHSNHRPHTMTWKLLGWVARETSPWHPTERFASTIRPLLFGAAARVLAGAPEAACRDARKGGRALRLTVPNCFKRP